MNKTNFEKYREAFDHIPAPGQGRHQYLLTIANRGVAAGRNTGQILDDIRNRISDRTITDREISQAILRAFNVPPPAINERGTYRLENKEATRRIIERATKYDEADLWDASPIRLFDDPWADMSLFLYTLFKPDDHIFIGDRNDTDTIRTERGWHKYFDDYGHTRPHIIVNPLTGKPARTKAGDHETLRGDGNVAEFRYCMAEFDDLSWEDQIRFWSAIRLPIVALIDSGGKSIHAWIDVSALAGYPLDHPEQWDREIKYRLYEKILIPMGVDRACSNPARLSRLPGHYRDGGRLQRLLWLSANGRPVCQR